MRWIRYSALAFATIAIASSIAWAQPSPGPTLLAPPTAIAAAQPIPAPEPAPAATAPTTAAAAEALPAPQNETTSPAAAGETAVIAPDDLLKDQECANWYEPGYWIDPLPWDSGLELGLNGSAGTNDSFSIRTGGYIKRESRFSKLNMSSYYNRTSTGGNDTQNNANLDIRNDWMLDDRSPWTLFGTGNVFYDQFQAFDVQTNVNTGVGYWIVHDPGLGMIGRLGAGTSREFGGPDDRWVPESLVGFEYNQQLATNQKFATKLDYFPEWDQVGEYRLVADAGWEIELIQPSNMSLKISASDRFDSTPNGAEPHLVNYSVLLLLKL